jgi:hypothetical protein
MLVIVLNHKSLHIGAFTVLELAFQMAIGGCKVCTWAAFTFTPAYFINFPRRPSIIGETTRRTWCAVVTSRTPAIVRTLIEDLTVSRYGQVSPIDILTCGIEIRKPLQQQNQYHHLPMFGPKHGAQHD